LLTCSSAAPQHAEGARKAEGVAFSSAKRDSIRLPSNEAVVESARIVEDVEVTRLIDAGAGHSEFTGPRRNPSIPFAFLQHQPIKRYPVAFCRPGHDVKLSPV
jgi:hypothetical protein